MVAFRNRLPFAPIARAGERSGTGSGAYTWGGSAGATGTGTSKTVTFPTAGTFTVTVFRAGSATSAAATLTVNADPTAPSIPAGLASSAITATSFTLSWTASTDNVSVTGYDVRLDGGVSVSANGAGGLSHTFTGLAFNSTHVVEVRARDTAGNVSTWSAHTAATNSGSTGLNFGQSAWLDVDGDGIRDEIVPADSADFYYDIVEWHTGDLILQFLEVNRFWRRVDTVLIAADAGIPLADFSLIFDEPALLQPDTWFELELHFRTQAGRPYAIYSDPISLPDANGVYPIDPANWTLFAQSEITPTADATQVVSRRFVDAFAFEGAQFFYVRKGLPLNLVRVSIPGVGDLDVGSGGLNGTLKLPNGATVGVGPSGGSIAFPGGGPSISISATGTVNVTGIGPLVAGQSLTVGAVTVEVDAGGNVIVSSGGTQVTLNAAGGGSIIFPGGVGIAVDATGRIGLAVTGASPIIASAVDTVNRVLNGDQLGAAIILADILGVETRIPTPIGDIDIAALTQGGLLGLGIERGTTVFQLTKPKPKIEFVRDQDGDHSVGLPDPGVDVLRIGHWGADRASGGGLSGYTDGTDGSPLNALAPNNFIDQDSNRFYVRVIHPEANVRPDAVDRIVVKVGTTFESGASDDALNEITLEETGIDSGIFVSEAQLLVGSDIPTQSDDAFEVVSKFGSTPKDEELDDRTHRATVEGFVQSVYRVDSRDHQVNAPVFSRNPDERRILNVMVTTFNEPWQDTNGNGQFDSGEPFVDITSGGIVGANFSTANPQNWGRIWSDAQIDVQMEAVRSILAPAGIIVREVGRVVRNPVGDLFKQSGSPTATPTIGRFDASRDNVEETRDPSRDHEIINTTFRHSSQNNGTDVDDVLDLYFVAPFTNADNARGVAFAPFSAAGAAPIPISFTNAAFISYGVVADNVRSTTAHEVLHHLTNRGHLVTPSYIVFPNGAGAAIDDGTTVLKGRRRIQAATAAEARLLRPDGNLTANGNRLLRNP